MGSKSIQCRKKKEFNYLNSLEIRITTKKEKKTNLFDALELFP